MRTIILATAALAVAGCGGDDDASCKAPAPTLESLHDVVFDRSCALSGDCHDDSKYDPAPDFDGDREDGSFDLTDPEDICQYIDVPAVSDELHRPIVTRGSCADSYLMIEIDPARESEITSSEELLAAQDGLHASAMPQRSPGITGTRLCRLKIDAVCEWIEAGAPGCE